MTIRFLAEKAKAASRVLAALSSQQRRSALLQMIDTLNQSRDHVLFENEADIESARANGLSNALLDRLALDAKRFSSIINDIREVADQTDPLGEVLERREMPNGLRLSRVRVPIGVVAIIYESRPNVTCEAASLCIKSGNAIILKGGSEALRTNRAMCTALRQALASFGIDAALVFIDSTDRDSVRELVRLEGIVDLAIPRGGEGLIRSVMEWARVPVIKHAKGVCHIFVDEAADLSMAFDICENAKCQRPGVCNAMESLLVHEKVASRFLPECVERLSKLGVVFRGDARAREKAPSIQEATQDDWGKEYLDLILSVKVVESLDEAISHINTFGSAHSDAIISNSTLAQQRFLSEVNSAVVYVNASTRFTDGSQFGMGAEIGISTDKLHVRGPMGATELTTYKWQVIGNGHIRPSR